jgi:hypothetical protein
VPGELGQLSALQWLYLRAARLPVLFLEPDRPDFWKN